MKPVYRSHYAIYLGEKCAWVGQDYGEAQDALTGLSADAELRAVYSDGSFQRIDITRIYVGPDPMHTIKLLVEALKQAEPYLEGKVHEFVKEAIRKGEAT